MRPLALPKRRFDLPPLESIVNLKRIRELDAILEERTAGSIGTVLANRLDQLRSALKAIAPESGAVMNATFLKTVESFVGHRRLLIQLYLLDEGLSRETKNLHRLAHLKDIAKMKAFEEDTSPAREYLPPLNTKMFRYLFVTDSEPTLLDGMRAARLFLSHFKTLPAYEDLGGLAEQVIVDGKQARRATGKVGVWRSEGGWLFKADGPQKLCESLHQRETLTSAAERLGIPSPSVFLTAARRYHVFSRLRNLPIGNDNQSLFDEIRESASERYEGQTTVGVKALQILIERSLKENQGELPDRWGMQISEFASDPRLPERTREFSTWWSWAKRNQLQVALTWFTGRDLAEFIKILDGSLEGNAKRMFPRRKDFLLKLFKAGKILRARLVLVGTTYRDVLRGLNKTSDVSIIQMSKSTGISVICIQCEGFSLVEGTETFALQLHRDIPIEGFWEGLALTGSARPQRWTEATFRQNRTDAISHIDSREKRWEQNFMTAIQRHFHVFWPDVSF